jgi:hypothetical protein
MLSLLIEKLAGFKDAVLVELSGMYFSSGLNIIRVVLTDRKFSIKKEGSK